MRLSEPKDLCYNKPTNTKDVNRMADVTAIILTKDEAKNIERCLRSIEGFASRRLVIDSGSTDDTVAIARSLGAEVRVHPFENYARQFNWGVDCCDIQTNVLSVSWCPYCHRRSPNE